MVSYNEELGVAEHKEVLETHCFGVDQDPKPMIEWTIDGKTIRQTYDHEYYTHRGWVPCYKLAWRAMAPGQRLQLKLLCQQYGQAFDDQLEEQADNQSDETSVRQFWVFENSDGRQDNQGSSGSGTDLVKEPSKQAPDKPHRQHEDEQSHRKSGVGNKSRKYGTHDEAGSSDQKPRRKVRNTYFDQEASLGDSTVSLGQPVLVETQDESGFSQEISSLFGEHPRYFERQELEVCSPRVLPAETTYDLTVRDNANYTVEGFLVHNTGKSTLAVNYAVWEALKKYESMVKAGQKIEAPLNYFIVAPTYRQAKTIYWNDIIKARIPREIVADYNEAELTITIPHHETDFGKPDVSNNALSLPAIVISLKGSDNEDSLRGVKLAGVVLDEYAFMKPQVWERIIRPALADWQGWSLFISTPNGFNHFYTLAEEAQGYALDLNGNWIHKWPDGKPGWFYSKATIYDNPHISPEEIQEIKESELAKDLDGTTWYQEYMAEFKQMAGLVFKEFDRAKHLVKADAIPAEGTRMIGIDFGYTNPFAAVFVIIDSDQNWYVYDLIYQSRMVTTEAINRLRDKMTGQYFTAIIGDSAAKQEIENFKSQHFPIRGATKSSAGTGSSIKAGIGLIAQKLRPQESPDGTLRPKLFIREDLKPLILEFEKYHYPESEEGTMVSKDIPTKEFDHAIDALRYLMLSRVEPTKPFQRRERHFDPVTGRSLS